MIYRERQQCVRVRLYCSSMHVSGSKARVGKYGTEHTAGTNEMRAERKAEHWSAVVVQRRKFWRSEAVPWGNRHLLC